MNTVRTGEVEVVLADVVFLALLEDAVGVLERACRDKVKLEGPEIVGLLTPPAVRRGSRLLHPKEGLVEAMLTSRRGLFRIARNRLPDFPGVLSQARRGVFQALDATVDVAVLNYKHLSVRERS